eukprot:10113483-Alexandrium_andersonii.AAC.1
MRICWARTAVSLLRMRLEPPRLRGGLPGDTELEMEAGMNNASWLSGICFPRRPRLFVQGDARLGPDPVSYTHLTLPTICSV